MDRGTRVFWVLIAVLVGASVYFGLGAEQRRRAARRGMAGGASPDAGGPEGSEERPR